MYSFKKMPGKQSINPVTKRHDFLDIGLIEAMQRLNGQPSQTYLIIPNPEQSTSEEATRFTVVFVSLPTRAGINIEQITIEVSTDGFIKQILQIPSLSFHKPTLEKRHLTFDEFLSENQLRLHLGAEALDRSISSRQEFHQISRLEALIMLSDSSIAAYLIIPVIHDGKNKAAIVNSPCMSKPSDGYLVFEAPQSEQGRVTTLSGETYPNLDKLLQSADLGKLNPLNKINSKRAMHN